MSRNRLYIDADGNACAHISTGKHAVVIRQPDIMICEVCYLPLESDDGVGVEVRFTYDVLTGESLTYQKHPGCEEER